MSTGKNGELINRTWLKFGSQLTLIFLVAVIKGTGSRFSACSFIKVVFFCRGMLYRLCKKHDHVIMLSKNQSAHSPGSHLHLINLNICK